MISKPYMIDNVEIMEPVNPPQPQRAGGVSAICRRDPSLSALQISGSPYLVKFKKRLNVLYNASIST